MTRLNRLSLLLLLATVLTPGLAWSQDVKNPESPSLDALPLLAPGEHTLHLRLHTDDSTDALISFTETLTVIGPKPGIGPGNDVETKGNRNPRIVLNLYRAFAEGDLDTINAIIHPDVVWIESEGIPYGGTFIGRDAVFEGVFGKIAEEWDGFTAEVDEVIDGGKQVVIVGRDSGTYKATGLSMEAPAVSVWTLNNKGQVIRFLQVIDTQAVMSAVEP